MKKNIHYKNISTFSDKNLNLKFEKFKNVNLTTNKNIKKVLIIKWGGMGDVIQAIPIIESLTNSFNFAEFHLNTKQPWNSLFTENRKIKKIWLIDFKKKYFGIFEIYKWLQFLRRQKYDLIIDLQSNDRSRILLSLLRFIYSAPRYIIGNHPVFPYTIYPNNFISIEQPFLKMKRTLASIGVKINKPSLNNFLTRKIIAKTNDKLKKYGLLNKEFIIFIPGSSKKNLLKRWGVINYVQLSKLLNFKVVLIGGAEDELECEEIFALNKNITNLCSKFSLLELIEVFTKAKIIIANDTGPTHLAALTNTPIIQIVGPTNPDKVKPLGKEILAVQSNIECKNCYKKTCGHHSCMSDVTPEDILNIIQNYHA